MGGQAAAFAFNYDKGGTMLGSSPGRIARSDIYVNRDQSMVKYPGWINYWAHEIGHAFGLADHPNDDINSVMSYQLQGRLLIGPSLEDIQGIARIYGLEDLSVRPENLDGAENIVSIWYYDRYGKLRSYERGWRQWRKWQFWMPGFSASDLGELTLLEIYFVQAKQAGTLGFGRFSLPVYPGGHFRWQYL
jgi:hypothetical protein